MAQALFDIEAKNRNRDRARRADASALFLHELVAEQVSERLKEVNRTFTSPAIVTAFPEIWLTHFPDATILVEAETLALNVGQHDLFIHALSLHASNDPVGQIIQGSRALKPDGLFLAAMFGGRTLNELRSSLAEAESMLFGGLSPRVFPMGELRELGGLLQRAGLALPVADTDMIPVTYPDLHALMRDLRNMGEGNALAGRSRQFTPRSLFSEAERIYRSNFGDADGRLRSTFDIIYLTGWTPSETQQKPLRPGSAVARLADALGTVETTFEDPVTGRR